MSSERLYDSKILLDSMSKVFSTMVFMDVDALVPDDESWGNEAQILGSISFSGNYDGALNIRCSLSCAKSITMNLLALDDEDDIEWSDLPDAVGEITNMIMGKIKSNLYDIVGELSVSIPTVISGDHIVSQLPGGAVRVGAIAGINGQYRIEINLVCAEQGNE